MVTEELELYKILDVNCEHCGRKITRDPVYIWIGDENAPNGERLGYFCDDNCLNDWWDCPIDPYSNGGCNID